MIRIHRLYSTFLASDRDRLEQVKAIFKATFPDVADYADKIADQLDHPFKYGYHAVLLVSEVSLGKVSGFALCFLLPEIDSALLDYIAVAADARGRGVGTYLYEAAREHLKSRGSRGLYMEAAPDDPAVVKDAAVLEQNRRRLAFYERYGVVPISGTEFETSVDDSPAPHLLFDGLGRDKPLGRSEARAAVRLILKRKYSRVASADYVERVVESFVDDPVRFRPRQYTPSKSRPTPVRKGRVEKAFVAVMSEAHAVHHVHDQGYVERPARVGAIREALSTMDIFETADVRHHGEEHVRSVHAGDFVAYLKAACLKLDSRRPVYPYVFPVRRPEKRPKELAVRAGYYCIDTFTPLDRNAYKAARAAVDVALTAAEELVRGRHVAYAVCRPPGHHAQHRYFGGFCYFNNAAIAAQFLSSRGRVAVLDIDHHHGNGTQDIFYHRNDVLTVSLHGHPNVAYPYFSGFADEKGEEDGKGFNLNLPLAENTDDDGYLKALERALSAIRRHKPSCLVVSLGFDILKGDPTGSFTLSVRTMTEIGRRIAALGLPMLFVQEGGYNLRNLRRGVVSPHVGTPRVKAQIATAQTKTQEIQGFLSFVTYENGTDSAVGNGVQLLEIPSGPRPQRIAKLTFGRQAEPRVRKLDRILLAQNNLVAAGRFGNNPNPYGHTDKEKRFTPRNNLNGSLRPDNYRPVRHHGYNLQGLPLYRRNPPALFEALFRPGVVDNYRSVAVFSS